MISIQVLCHVVDLKHGFVTSWENVIFMLENIGICVKITWNYFLCLVLHKVKVFIDYGHRLWSSVLNKTTFSGIIGNKCYCNNFYTLSLVTNRDIRN